LQHADCVIFQAIAWVSHNLW